MGKGENREREKVRERGERGMKEFVLIFVVHSDASRPDETRT